MRKMIFSTMPFDYFEQHRSGALYDKETYFLNFINSAYHYALLLGVFGLAIGLVIVGYFFPFGTNKTLGEAKKKLYCDRYYVVFNSINSRNYYADCSKYNERTTFLNKEGRSNNDFIFNYFSNTGY